MTGFCLGWSLRSLCEDDCGHEYKLVEMVCCAFYVIKISSLTIVNRRSLCSLNEMIKFKSKLVRMQRICKY